MRSRWTKETKRIPAKFGLILSVLKLRVHTVVTLIRILYERGYFLSYVHCSSNQLGRKSFMTEIRSTVIVQIRVEDSYRLFERSQTIWAFGAAKSHPETIFKAPISRPKRAWRIRWQTPDCFKNISFPRF